MKKITFILSLSMGLLFSCNSNSATQKIVQENLDKAQEENVANRKFPIMTFERTEYDFGEIPGGTSVETTFKFTNTGEVPLVITDVASTCGCTVPEKPEKPIAPGESSQIRVAFNGSGSNQVTKSVTVSSNTQEGSQTLTIKAFVKN